MGEAGCFRARGSRAQRHLGLVLDARHRRDAASKKVEGVADLAPAHCEGRRETDSGASDEVDEQPVLEAVLEDPGGYLRPELRTDEQALPAHLRAGYLLRHLLERALEDGTLDPNLLEEGGVVYHPEDRLDRGHREWVAPEGRAVVAGT